MERSQRCIDCGAAISRRAAPGGICPRCLLTLGLSLSGDQPDHVDRIGPYRILRQLGEGGMGVVYLAEQEAPIRRQVALKLIKAGMDTKQVVARFESERQALALMDHPNIARVLDAGATEQGRPYFVMEYVQGQPVTQYCDRRRLTTQQRLELFTGICEGVQHAHQKGVIHRDIKSSNVLIAEQDGAPVPKIIDFGVAKAVRQRLTEKSLFTERGVLIGTPEYMSPEQVDPGNMDIDTRTDVYSLGVLLYELLVGRLPFESAELRRAAWDEICRRIREDEPSRPSQRVSTLGDASSESASRRRTEPSALVRALRGELDWITMKAMEKDRMRRYASPGEFAADVKRYLVDEPVAAGPPNRRYRFEKFVRRHRAGVGFATVLVVFLMGFAVVMTLQATRIAAERDRANQEARTAEQVTEFVVGLFDVVDPREARGNTITAREILDVGIERIERELADQPSVRARLFQTVGRVYTNLGLYDDAEPPLAKALEEQRRLSGEAHPATLKIARQQGWLYLLQGRYEDAESALDEAYRTALGSPSTAGPETFSLMVQLANVYRHQGRYDEAEPLMVEALEAQRRELPKGDRGIRMTMANLASLYVHMSRYDEAVRLRLRLLEIERRQLGEDHPYTLADIAGVANLYRIQGRSEESEDLFLQALEGQVYVLGEDHPRTQDTKTNLATLYVEVGRYEEAEPLFLQVLASDRERLGPAHPDTLITMGQLASLYKRQGRYAEAEPLNLKVLFERRAQLGEDHPWTLASLHGLARLRSMQGNGEEALELLGQAVDAGFTNWGDPATILDRWREFDGNPKYESIVAGFRAEVETGDH